MIKVLVVDDLFFMRSLISELLNSDPEIKVIGTAKDGKDALEKIPKFRPDVITLDLSMPGMDGLTALQEIMNRYPTPVVILSAHESRKEADVVLKCLNSGAVGFVFKPSRELSLDIEKIKHWLLQEIKAVAAVDVKHIMRCHPEPFAHSRSLEGKLREGSSERTGFFPATKALAGQNDSERRIVVIGASTGGPQTLEAILSVLPSNFPFPIIVAQHVPGIFFSQSLAKRLNNHCHLNVKVAEDGEVIRGGDIYLIPFGFSPSFRLEDETSLLRLKPAHTDHTPSIDETMSSISKAYHKNILGIILTGIGSDGVKGMKAIKLKGGRTIAQDESALINGMPGAVVEAGLADQVLSLEGISEAILKFGKICQ